MSQTTAIGSCLCGAVRFEVTLPAKWCANCHCSVCRRAHSAPYVTWAGFEQSAFRVVAGEEHRRRYRSSPHGSRTFCGQCGSQLTFEAERWAEEVHVPRACLPEDLELAPKAHCYFDSGAPWLRVHDDLPRLGGAVGNEPIGAQQPARV